MKIYYLIIILVFNIAQRLQAQTDSTAFDFGYQKPVFKLENEQLTNKRRFLRSIVFTGYREGVEPIKGPYGIKWRRYDDAGTGTSKIAMYNLSIIEILNSGWPVSPHKIILEVRDPLKYMYKPEYGSKESWMRANACCYEFTMPTGLLGAQRTLGQFNPMIWQEEIWDFFGVNVSKERRVIKALVLVRTSSIDKIKSKEMGKGKYDLSGHYKNVPIDRLGDFYNNNIDMLPFIDGTGYAGNVDLDLQISDWTNLTEVRKQLQRYDLDLKEEMREVKGVLVVKEINPEN